MSNPKEKPPEFDLEDFPFVSAMGFLTLLLCEMTEAASNKDEARFSDLLSGMIGVIGTMAKVAGVSRLKLLTVLQTTMPVDEAGSAALGKELVRKKETD